MHSKRSDWPGNGIRHPLPDFVADEFHIETIAAVTNRLSSSAHAMNMKSSENFLVNFLPAAKQVTCASGERLMEVARAHGVHIAADCGGHARCRSCAVRLEGSVPEATAADHGAFTEHQLEKGWRRACQVNLAGACTVHVPARTNMKITPLGQDDGPGVVPIYAPVLVPAREAGCWIRGGQLVGPVAGPRALGLAVDLGTSSIAAALLDISSGEVIATGAIENPQSVYSADVIGRLTLAVQNPSRCHQMQRLAAQAMAELAHQLSRGDEKSIAEVAVVGNPVMQHLLLGLPLDTLARAPYRPHTLDAVEVLASEVGLHLAPGAWLHCGPNIAGFIGSDHVAALLDLMSDPPRSPWVLMDIGTNTEISIFADGKILSASCASGPAFEGGMLSCGMRAAAGAVTGVRLENGDLRLGTVDQAEPVGICGSGVISLLAELLRNGIINSRGRLLTNHRLVREQGGKRRFVIAENNEDDGLPLVFTQDDIRAVQLAKAAIRSGLEFLLNAAGVREDAIERFVIAGAFGKYLDLEAASAIGLLPAISSDRIVQVGNAAGAGVRRLLVCAEARAKALQLARRAQYIELATQPDFHAIFARRMAF